MCVHSNPILSFQDCLKLDSLILLLIFSLFSLVHKCELSYNYIFYFSVYIHTIYTLYVVWRRAAKNIEPKMHKFTIRINLFFNSAYLFRMFFFYLVLCWYFVVVDDDVRIHMKLDRMQHTRHPHIMLHESFFGIKL